MSVCVGRCGGGGRGGVEESLFQEESIFWGIVAVDQVLENGIFSEFA